MNIAKNLLIALLAVTFLTGWGDKKQFGDSIPEDVSPTKLKAILENPDAYKDKEVVLEGNYGTACCPTDFSYKEGVETIAVAPKGFSSPKKKLGSPVLIFGVVRSGAVPEESGEEKEAAQGESANIFIEAKGVQFK